MRVSWALEICKCHKNRRPKKLKFYGVSENKTNITLVDFFCLILSLIYRRGCHLFNSVNSYILDWNSLLVFAYKLIILHSSHYPLLTEWRRSRSFHRFSFMKRESRDETGIVTSWVWLSRLTITRTSTEGIVENNPRTSSSAEEIWNCLMIFKL